MKPDLRSALAPNATDESPDAATAVGRLDREAVAASKAIQRRTGRTFHLATRFFPAEVRHATYVLYGFVRIADEVVDGDDAADPAVQRAAIDRLRAVAVGEAPTDHPVLSAFQSLRAAVGITRADVEAFLDSMAADVDGAGTRYASMAEVDAYVHGSAAAVGHMMCAVMGVEDDAARPHAGSLGAAFQLTNFVRDVREDRLELDRVYLPESALRRHGASHDEIERLVFDDRVAAAVEDVLVEAEARYRHGVAGIRYLPAGCRFPVLAAAVLYAEYHAVVRAADFDVVSARPRLGTRRKLAAMARTAYHWLRSRDPETAFYAASAVSQVPDDPAAARVGGERREADRLRARLPGGQRGD